APSGRSWPGAGPPRQDSRPTGSGVARRVAADGATCWWRPPLVTFPLNPHVGKVVGSLSPMRRPAVLLPVLLLAACGEVGRGAPAPSQPSVRQVLLEPPEQVEALPAQTRADLFRSLLRATSAGAQDGLLVLFPIVKDGAVRAAPPIVDGRLDLLD